MHAGPALGQCDQFGPHTRHWGSKWSNQKTVSSTVYYSALFKPFSQHKQLCYPMMQVIVLL